MGNYTYLRFGKKLQMCWKYSIPYHILYTLFEPSDWVLRRDRIRKAPYLKTTVAKGMSRFVLSGISEGELLSHVSRITGASSDKICDYLELLLEYGPDSYKHMEQYGFSDFDESNDSFFSMEAQLVDCPRELHKDMPLWMTDPASAYQSCLEVIELFIVKFILNNLGSSTKVMLDLSDSGLDEEEYGRVFEFCESEIQMKIETTNYLMRLIEIDKIRNRLTEYFRREKDFTNEIVIPLLHKMGFQRVESRHGPKEQGLDLNPFYMVNPFGVREYYGIQIKAVDIHGNASRRNGGNISEIFNQVTSAFDIKHEDIHEGTEYFIDHMIIVTCSKITENAKSQIHSKMSGKRKVICIDNTHLAELIKKHNIWIP
jgi:hypothetical protein